VIHAAGAAFKANIYVPSEGDSKHGNSNEADFESRISVKEKKRTWTRKNLIVTA
jgi:hypothetical protein